MAGGQGGEGGAGGTGDTGQAGGSNSGTGIGGGGGGGAGAGMNNGGAGGVGGNDFGNGHGGASGAGGTAGSPNGSAGGAGTAIATGGSMGSAAGGGGGGGGYAGYYGFGLGTLKLGVATSTFTGGAGGSGGAGAGSVGATGGGGGGGGAGGYGAVATGGQVTNAATLIGGAGGAGGAGGSGGGGVGGVGGSGGDGGVGLAATASGGAVVTNSGSVTGGAGGAEGATYDSAIPESAGVGGAGVTITVAGSSLSNSGTITGGVGGDGGTSGTGGTGGAGVAAGTGSVVNSKTITGGAGGFGASGGIGGTGVAGAGSVTNSATITGGGGGNSFDNGGAGGAGVAGATSVTNNAMGTITGGYAGGGRNPSSATDGGVGVAFTGTGGTLTNAGLIEAGASAAGTGVSELAGRAAVTGDGITVVDTGTISGGAGVGKDSQGDAITFAGGTNIVAFGATAGMAGPTGLTGALDIQAGTLKFDQTKGSGLPSSVTVSDQITGGGAVVQDTTGGTLTLTNAEPGTYNTYGGGTTISGGTLAVASDRDLGATSGGLTLGTGTLETTTGFTTARTVMLTDSASQTNISVVQVDTGTTTLGGLVSGDAAQFVKTGAGTLVLGDSGNTYDATTTVDAGTLSISSDGDLGNTSGALTLAGGTLETTATLTSGRVINVSGNSTVQVDTGTTTLSSPVFGAASGELTKTGIGTLSLSRPDPVATTIADGTLDLAVHSNATITFAGSAMAPATLALETSAQTISGTFPGTLAAFGADDLLDLKGFAYTGTSPSTQETYTPTSTTGTTTNGTLTITENGETETFDMSGVALGTTFYAESDGSAGGGTLVYALCFASGTRIRTVRGQKIVDVAVEALRVGDVAVTASGEHRPIRWIGHRHIERPGPDQHPVRIRAGAFGAGVPARDLRLSPGHPVSVGADADGEGGHLVPIMCLINGTTIARVPVASVGYWHVELDAHDILLAEGLAAESYLELGDRGFFDAAAGRDPLADPDLVMPGLAGRCRPVAIDGAIVEAERRRLDAVFAAELGAMCRWPTTEAPLHDL